MIRSIAIAAALIFATAGPGFAASAMPFLSPVFSSHMVLQRDMADPVWGWTEPGAAVTVTVGDKSVTATAGTDGRWQAALPSMPASADAVTMTVKSPNHADVVVDDILVGDVWICSGQSNMGLNVNSSNDAKAEIANANHTDIRLFTVAVKTALQPQPVCDGTWDLCTPTTIPGFSAAAYYFGRDLQEKLKVPIGLIHTSVGGTPAESWTSEPMLRKRLPEFNTELDAVASLRGKTDLSDAQTKIEKDTNNPSVLFNAMINPLIPFGFKGVIWYQGENNAHSPRDGQHHLAGINGPAEYRALLRAMIDDWRVRWGQGEFPFLIVQLAGFGKPADHPVDDDWAELRAAQWDVHLKEKNVGIMTAVDIGESGNIHPKNKQEVGRRLSLVALHDVYGKDFTAYGPVYKSMTIERDTIRLEFDQTDRGIKSTTPKLEGFAIAGADRKFVWADAKIEGNIVVVSSPKITHPTQVTYAWAGFMPNTLVNSAGLPAFPFRTLGE